MADQMIRLPEVSRITSLSRTHIYRLMSAQDFPQQRRISHRVAVWSKAEVDRWVDEKLGLLV